MKIAPPQKTCLDDKQLEILIHHTFRKYPHLLKCRKYIETNPSYRLVERKTTGPRFVQGETMSRTKIETEYYKKSRPGPATYEQDDRILHEKLRDQKFGMQRDKREYQKAKRGDWRDLLYPELDAVKPSAPRTVINKEHFMTDHEIDKLYEEVCGPGPASYQQKHKLTEKRADVGVVKFD